MKMSICTDAQGRVTGVCPDNLSGGDGWVWIETDLTPATELYDGRGIALYKLVDSVVVSRGNTEIETDAPVPLTPEPTIDQRVSAVEQTTVEIVEILEGIV